MVTGAERKKVRIMVCPSCHSDHMTRFYCCIEQGSDVKRYRECAKCGQRFTTIEQVLKKIGEPMPMPGRDDAHD